ncbi:MAG: hypothetical protein B7Z73_18725, partial [Planctomycetia bacterium 21-64-5]
MGVASVPLETRTLPGRGLVARGLVGASPVFLGSPRLMREQGLAFGDRLRHASQQFEDDGRSLVCIGWQGQVRGIFGFDEKLRPEVREMIDGCRRLALKVSVLSG